MSTQTFDARDGQVLNYADSGKSGVVALVWIHGMWNNLHYWDGIWQHFPDFRHVRVDVPGHGLSPARLGSVSLEQFGYDIIDLIQHLALPRVILVGHSLGGIIALRAALDDPSHVLGLVLISTSSRVNSKARAAWRQRAQDASAQGYAAIAAIQLMVANMELEHEMPKLSGLPVLILQGAEDRQTPLRAGEILHKQLAQSELNVFRSGHNLMPESSDAIRCCAEWLADFPMRPLTAGIAMNRGGPNAVVPAGIVAVIGHQPPVTRCLLFASASLMVLCTLEILSPFTLYLNWQLIIYELQLWRLVTCFLFLGTFSLPYCWNTWVLVHYCSSLEDVAFHQKSADFLWMLICGAGMILALTYFFGNTYFVSGALIDLMTYVWGRRNSTAQMQVLFFTVRAPYLPWVLSWISLLMGGNIQDHLLGIAVGHTYFFFEDVYPLLPTSKGFRLFRTPRLLKMVCNETE
ncbi:unnamed protein product [Durusdinium trenchii]|uniref:Derlin n=3 Tax=Durusdinium trenchii TaxID=1381693 RepID=A0ABP0J3E1_9DINO